MVPLKTFSTLKFRVFDKQLAINYLHKQLFQYANESKNKKSTFYLLRYKIHYHSNRHNHYTDLKRIFPRLNNPFLFTVDAETACPIWRLENIFKKVVHQ